MSQQRSYVDENGTPFRGLYFGNLVDRQITELLGLAKGIICDGVVNDAEIVALKQWSEANPEASTTYPGNLLLPRLATMMQDGVPDETERAELKGLLLDLTGEPADQGGTMNSPSTLPLDQPPPLLTFIGHQFVFTGICASGTRAQCQQQVVRRGGTCGKYITVRTSCLVIGMMASPAWIQSTHGRKIEQAVSIRERGNRAIHIVSEEHWLAELKRAPIVAAT